MGKTKQTSSSIVITSSVNTIYGPGDTITCLDLHLHFVFLVRPWHFFVVI